MNKNDTAKEEVVQEINLSPENDINHSCFGLTVSPLFPKENVNENNNLTKNVPNNRPTKSKILNCIEKLYPADSELRKIAEDISTVNGKNVFFFFQSYVHSISR